MATAIIKTFLHSINPQLHITPAIHYLPLVDENPDSEDTLLHISEDLLEKLGSDCQDYVFLVGDGKTYQHLMKIKNKYGHALSKLLIYPGDWHLLKNYQEVLMKQYYYAGLKELAMASGFRSSTLKSLESCGNFKRTHYFFAYCMGSTV